MGVTPAPPACPPHGMEVQASSKPGMAQHGALDISLVSHRRAAHAGGTAWPCCSSAGRGAASKGCFTQAVLSNPSMILQISSATPALGTGGMLQRRALSKSALAAIKDLTESPARSRL